jgi:4-amino-4-deoxy-L-arabinose transferase-like glycosyltransferase
MLLGLCGIGLAERIYFLNRPMRFDEADSFLTFASRPLYVAISWYSEPNNHLFHTLLMHFSWMLFGDHEWALRLPAMLAGMLTIPATYWATRYLYGKHEALIAAALVATASPLIRYSAEGRGYTITCLLFLLLLLASRDLLEHDRPPVWLIWAVLAALGLYTVPTMIFGIGTAAVWVACCGWRMVARTQRREWYLHLAGALALTGVFTVTFYAPVLIASGWRSLTANSYVASKSFDYFIAHLPHNFADAWDMLTGDVPPALQWILASAFAAGIVFHRGAARDPMPLPVAGAIGILPIEFAQRVLPYARVWLFLFPVFAAVTAAGLWMAARLVFRSKKNAPFHAPALVAALCVAPMCIPDLQGTRLRKADYLNFDECALWVKRNPARDDVVLALGGIQAPLSYYMRRETIPLIHRPAACDPRKVVVYAPKNLAERESAGRPLHVLAIAAGPVEKLEDFGNCIATSGTQEPVPVYNSHGIRMFEGDVSEDRVRALFTRDEVLRPERPLAK